MEIVLGMRGNHSSGRGSQSLGRGRGSQQTVRGGGIQLFLSGNNTINVLPHSPTCKEDTLASPPLNRPVLFATDIPSSSHFAPVGNVSSIPPTLGGTSDATAALTTAGFSQFMPNMQTNDKIFIRPTIDNKQYVFYKNLLCDALKQGCLVDNPSTCGIFVDVG